MKRILLTLLASAALSLVAGAKTDLTKYVIVYPASAEAEEGLDIAEAVAATVESQTGIRIPVVSDDTPEVRKEILVGKTTRKESAVFYAAKPDTFDYALSAKGNKILVQGGGCWALMKAVAALEKNGVPKKAITGNIYGEPIFSRAEGTNLRILDDNIWQYDKDVNAPTWEAMGLDCRDEVRCRGFAELVWATTPDIVALQEYSANMDAYLYPLLKERGYVRAYDPEGQWNYTPVFYNPQTVTLLETSFHKYNPSDWSNGGTKSYNACLFSLKANGKKFYVINTHLWWKGEKAQPGSDEARTAQVRKMMTAVDDAVFAHGCPVFMMGDMNCNLTSKAMKQLLEAGYKPLVWEATVFGDPRCGHHPCNANGFSRQENKSNENGMGAIDQFFIYNGKGEIRGESNTEILVFQRIYAYFTIELTDHYPNYADIRLQ